MSNSNASLASDDTGRSALNFNTETWRASMQGVRLMLTVERSTELTFGERSERDPTNSQTRRAGS